MTSEKKIKGTFEQYQLIARRARFAVLISYFGLFITFTITALLLPTCNRSPNTVIWLIHIIPMLLFIHGVLTRNVRTHVWVAFISLGYFLASVNAIFACPTMLTGVEVGLIVVLFTSSTMYIRWRSRELKLSSSNDK